jgi:hypothetical protein
LISTTVTSQDLLLLGLELGVGECALLAQSAQPLKPPIKDIDQVAENGTWTAGNTEVALCAPGERLLSGGFAFTETGNKEVTFLRQLPFVSPQTNGVSGEMATNSGGTAKGEIVALCLK